ncbi:MAG: DUF3667 domain-containing protein [Maribacter sp.]|nr:DUF3667 domain-containing protein [Maribacter sp.]
MNPELPTYCKNCGEITEDLFCAHCGQRSSVSKVTFSETFHDLTENLFANSAPLPLTFRQLAKNPGLLLREYLNGKRKKYYRPISFFILSTLVYLFIRWVIDFDDYVELPLGGEKVKIDSELIAHAREYMFQNIKSLAFILVLTMAIFMKLFFRKRYTLAEYLAVSFYLNGFYSLLATLNLFFIKYISPKIQFLAMLAMCAYFVYVMVSFFQNQRYKVGLKSFLIYWLAYAAYVFLAIFISYLIVMFEQT